MNQRKLIKLGNSSFAIALPKGWVDKAGLKKGDNVFLEENGQGELKIRPSPSEKNNNKTISIDVTDKDLDSSKKDIRAAYIRGYDIIELKGVKNKKIKRDYKKILEEFLIFDLTDSKDDLFVIKDFFNLEEANLSNFIRRMDNNIREIFEILIEELKKETTSSQRIKEVEEIDRDVNKFYFLCSRVFLKGTDNPSILTTLKTNGMSLFNNWWFSFHLEALSDGLKYFIKAVNHPNVINSKEKMNEILLKIYEIYIQGVESFYKEDAESAKKTMNMTYKIRSEIEKLEKNNPQVILVSQNLLHVVRQVYQNAKMVLYLKY